MDMLVNVIVMQNYLANKQMSATYCKEDWRGFHLWTCGAMEKKLFPICVARPQAGGDSTQM